MESAVKVAKSLINKPFKDNKDPWVALLEQRNTPTSQLSVLQQAQLKG